LRLSPSHGTFTLSQRLAPSTSYDRPSAMTGGLLAVHTQVLEERNNTLIHDLDGRRSVLPKPS
jgi:hypothetical protein